MGVVYLARQLSLGRLVALKMLPADLAGDEVALARFRREMRLLARCEHPNIVKVLASGTMPDGQLYYAMEYVPGCDLEQVWRELAGVRAARAMPRPWAAAPGPGAVLSASRKKREQTTRRPGTSTDAPAGAAPAEEPVPVLPLPPLPELPSAPDDPGGYVRRVARWCATRRWRLQAVHDQQVVHRDVKPANLMLTPDGSRVVLMDFGLAKGQSLALTASRAGGLLGTLRYAAPEQLAAASPEGRPGGRRARAGGDALGAADPPPALRRGRGRAATGRRWSTTATCPGCARSTPASIATWRRSWRGRPSVGRPTASRRRGSWPNTCNSTSTASRCRSARRRPPR